VSTEIWKRTTKGRSLWKPRRELLTPTPSVRSQVASARRLLYATRLVVPLKHPPVKTDKGLSPSRRNLETGSFFLPPSRRSDLALPLGELSAKLTERVWLLGEGVPFGDSLRSLSAVRLAEDGLPQCVLPKTFQ
jgi:hypothetical protein